MDKVKEYTREELIEINDYFRTTFNSEYKGIKFKTVITRGVAELSQEEIIELIRIIMAYDDFEKNNPYEEHQFGRFQYKGEWYNYKIDYYDENLEYYGHYYHVLTILKAIEY